jgi:hypothetical protein
MIFSVCLFGVICVSILMCAHLPGLIYRMKDPKVVLLIFVSGKVVLTGAPHA